MNTDVLKEILVKIDDPIVLSVILLLVVFLLVYKTEIASKIFKKPAKQRIGKIEDLRNHNVFNTLKRIKYEVSNMKFYTHQEFDLVKTQMCEDFTHVKSDVCSRMMLEFLDYGIETMDKDKLKKTIVDIQVLMHETYIDDIRRIWIARRIKPEDVDYVIALFEKFRYDVVNSFEHRINSIFASNNYQNNFSLVLAIFEMWAMGIDLLPRDMQTTFENLNGKFKNIDYER